MIQVIRELVARELDDPERDLNGLIQVIRLLFAKELANPERDCKRVDQGN